MYHTAGSDAGHFDNGASRGEVAARMASPGRAPSRCTKHRKVPRQTLREARWPSMVAMVARGGTRVVVSGMPGWEVHIRSERHLRLCSGKS